MLTGLATASAQIRALSFSGEPWAVASDGSKGVIPRFYELLAKNSGLDIQVDIVPYKRMLVMLDSGDGDIAIFFKSRKSVKVADPLVLLTTLNTVVFPRRGLQLTRYEDLSNLTIGVKGGVAIQPRFDEDRQLRKKQFNSYYQAAQLLMHDRVDAVTGSEGSLRYNFAKTGYVPDPNDKALALFSREVWLQTSKAHSLAPDIVTRLATETEQLASSDRYRHILDKIITEALTRFQQEKTN